MDRLGGGGPVIGRVFIQSFTQHLLIACYVTGSLPSAGDTDPIQRKEMAIHPNACEPGVSATGESFLVLWTDLRRGCALVREVELMGEQVAGQSGLGREHD